VDAKHRLFDLERDPGELHDVAADHADVVDAHAARIEALSRALGATGAVREKISDDERERLRVLGYLE
jgi:hypothetical protein